MAPENYDRHFRSKVYDLETEVAPDLWNQIDEKLRPRRRPFPIWWFGLSAGGTLILIMLFWPHFQKKIFTESPIPPIHPTPLTDQEFAPPQTQEQDWMAQIERSAEEPTSVRDYQKRSRSSAGNPTKPLDVAYSIPSNAPRAPTPGRIDLELIEERQSRLQKESDDGFSDFPPSIKDGRPGRHDLDHLTILVNPPKLLSRKTLLEHGFDPEINSCPSFGVKNLLRPFVEFSVGGGIPLRHLAVLIPEVSDYQALRESTEKVQGFINISGLIGADIGKHFEVKGGLSFTQLNEVFDYVDQSATRTVTNIVTDTITVDGVTQIRSDTSIVTEYGQRIKLTNNNFRFLDIPLMGGYRWRMGQHSLIFQGGAALNLALWKEVDLLAPDGTIVNADSRNPNAYPAFRSSTGIDLLAEAGYVFDITEQNSLRIIASVRHPLQSISHKSYPLSQKYTQIKLGLSWKHYLW